MRRLGIILVAVAGLALLFGMLWPFETKLDAEDLSAITTEVRRHTAEPVLSITPEPRWRVRVTTGTDVGPLSGGGHKFELRQDWGGWGRWRVYATILWIG